MMSAGGGRAAAPRSSAVACGPRSSRPVHRADADRPGASPRRPTIIITTPADTCPAGLPAGRRSTSRARRPAAAASPGVRAGRPADVCRVRAGWALFSFRYAGGRAELSAGKWRRVRFFYYSRSAADRRVPIDSGPRPPGRPLGRRSIEQDNGREQAADKFSPHVLNTLS
jgi:hypothetical protein